MEEDIKTSKATKTVKVKAMVTQNSNLTILNIILELAMGKFGLKMACVKQHFRKY